MRTLLICAALATACGGSPSSGSADLIASDPLRHDYDFTRAAYGAEIQNGQVKNAGSQLDFGNYAAGAFTVGIQGSDVGRIYDFGDDAQLAASLGAGETLGGGQGFAALDENAIRRDGAAANVLLELHGDTSAPVVLGHVYGVRVLNETSDTLVKLVVTRADASEAQLDWARLR